MFQYEPGHLHLFVLLSLWSHFQWVVTCMDKSSISIKYTRDYLNYPKREAVYEMLNELFLFFVFLLVAPSSFEAVVQRVPFEYVEVQENREDQERHHQQEENQEPVSQRVICGTEDFKQAKPVML